MAGRRVTPEGNADERSATGKVAGRQAPDLGANPSGDTSDPGAPVTPASSQDGTAGPVRHGRRSGLGRGLAALIPSGQDEEAAQGARPLDVLFPGRTDARTPHTRGGSARDLLVPGTQGQAKGRGGSRSQQGSAHKRTAVPTAGSAARPAGTPANEDVSEQTHAEPQSAVKAATEASRGHLGTPKAGGGRSEVKADTHAPGDGSGSSHGSHSPTSEQRGRGTESPTQTGRDTSGKSTPIDPGDSPEKGSNGAGSPDAHAAGPSPDQSPVPGVGRRARSSELFADLLPGTGDVSRETSENHPATDPGSQEDSQPVDSAMQEADLVSVPGTTFADLPTAWIIPNHRQPREVFDEDELNELAASIREVGVLQPVVVRPIDTSTAPGEALLQLLEERPDARYELIMGERRLRASEIAGLTSVPAIVRHTDDNDLLRDALLENLHRAQLNPLEEASAYQQLMADFGATQEELAQRIARSRPQIANTLRLLRLPPSVQRKVAAGVISAGHARALLSLGTPVEMDALADRIVSEGLSVRTTEELVRLGQSRRPQTNPRRRTAVLSPLGESLVSRLSDAYDTRVTITEGRSKGRIVIEFAGPDDLQRLAGLIVPDKPNTL